MSEMKDRSLQEIDELFIKRVPARKFKMYCTVGIEHMHDDEVDRKGVIEIKPNATNIEREQEVL